MGWTKVMHYRGWMVSWHDRDHRMYAEKNIWSGIKSFSERPASLTAAHAIAKAWIDSR